MTTRTLVTLAVATSLVAACSKKRVEPTPLAVAPKPTAAANAEPVAADFPALDDAWLVVRARLKGLVDRDARALLEGMWTAKVDEVAIGIRPTGATIISVGPEPADVTHLRTGPPLKSDRAGGAGPEVRTMLAPVQAWPFEMVQLPGNVILASAWRGDLERGFAAAKANRKLELELESDEAIALQVLGMRFGFSQRADRIRMSVTAPDEKADPGLLLGMGLRFAKRSMARGSKLKGLLDAFDKAPRVKDGLRTTIEAPYDVTLQALASDLVKRLHRQRPYLTTRGAIAWWLSLLKRHSGPKPEKLSEVFTQKGFRMPPGADRDVWGWALRLRIEDGVEIVCSPGRNAKHGDYDDICGRNKRWSFF